MFYFVFFFFFFFKQKTAYEMRISDWSSDVCSSDLDHTAYLLGRGIGQRGEAVRRPGVVDHAGEGADFGCGSEEPFHLIRIGQVGLHDHAGPAERANTRGRLLGGLRVAEVAEDEVVSVVGKTGRDRRTDAAGAAGDEGQ